MKKFYYFWKKGSVIIESNIFRFIPDDLKETKSKYSIDDESTIEIKTEKRDIPIENIFAIAVFADVIISKTALGWLAQKEIPIFYFDKNANPIGTFIPYHSTNDGRSIVLQTENYISKEKRMFIASTFLFGAIHNIIKNLEYYNNRGRAFSALIDTIKKISTKISAANDISNLMLIEAYIRKIYYMSFNHILTNDIKFSKREFNPPTDPMNALISFGNTLLYSVVETEMFTTKLNPFISFLHEPGAKRASLVWDMAEVFKPILVDRLIFSLLNHKIIDLQNFDFIGSACYLNDTGKKKFVRHFDEKINKPIFNRENKKHQSFRTIIKFECYKLLNHFKEEKLYSPFKIWW